MRLRTIRLAGFKSFVDPVSIDLPGDMIGVVGPNGCGKSNIIDAVRWVMGEISARHLRGASMADVVFNGSNSRRPVGQASVELVFDNSDARIGGRFAQYAEVAVKRQVGRDGQSAYFLNGTRCRRRDVIDVFLGTGLGPRSYAVIEQGTISRLVEAKPDELREVLEEAAGISKYKERRRETESRMKHTEENLARISDLRDELENRLDKLERQAKQAERFKTLKVEERVRKAELLSLRWRDLDNESQAHGSAVNQANLALEKGLAELASAEAVLVDKREAQRETGDAFNAAYREKVEADAAIARAEESIESFGRRRQELEQATSDDRASLAAARERADNDQRRLADLRQQSEAARPEVERLEAAAKAAEEALSEADRSLSAAQVALDEATRAAAEPAGIVVREQARIEQLERSVASIGQRRIQLDGDATNLDTTTLVADLATLAPRLGQATANRESLDAAVESQTQSVRELRERHGAAASELHQSRAQLQACGGRIASLEALQQEALGGAGKATDRWLEDRDLAGARRLAELLRVAQGWERAAEVVLAGWLDALALDGGADALADLAGSAASLDAVRVTMLGAGHHGAGRQGAAADAGALSPPAAAGIHREEGPAPWLAVRHDGTFSRAPGGLRPLAGLLDPVPDSPFDIGTLLHGVYVADDFEAAISAARQLAAGQSIVTADGTWVGPNWMRVVRGEAEDGVLRREQALRSLHAERDECRERVERLGAEMTGLDGALKDADARLSSARAEVSKANREESEVRSRNATLGERLEQMQRNLTRVDSERGDLDRRAQEQQGELDGSRVKLEDASGAAASLGADRDRAAQARRAAQETANGARDRARGERAVANDRQLSLGALDAQLAPLAEGIERQGETITALDQRIEAQVEAVAGLAQPLEQMRGTLETALTSRGEFEQKLSTARSENEALEEAVRDGEERRRRAELAAAELREGLNSARMQGEETRVRRQTIEEQLVEYELEPAKLLEALPDEATAAAWQEQVEAIERRIQRLGAVNLAAIEEYDSEAERKQYLDAQFADLDEALATLREAIGRIDRETRQRFKETFEKVNTGLQDAFPRLFGGGEATLELVGEDLLDTGVTIMARPPGKRNASISLLSGGEKALTAVALVFSIFQLNPAPFCLLDEVDAPLDDSNVGRFCELVKVMSERVQFLVVTHNKITMEASQQLVGVTMQEAGVSRLVAVDIDEAVEMAAA